MSLQLRHCFGPDSEFFHQLLFFYNAKHIDDFMVLVEACRLLRKFVQENGNYTHISFYENQVNYLLFFIDHFYLQKLLTFAAYSLFCTIIPFVLICFIFLKLEKTNPSHTTVIWWLLVDNFPCHMNFRITHFCLW